MMNAADISELFPEFKGVRLFLKDYTRVKVAKVQQPRYKIGWSTEEVDAFVKEVGKENSQLIAVSVIESDDISFYSYIYRPNNSLLLIYDNSR